MRAAPTVAVVVPAHRDGPALARCLAAVDRLDPRPAEVVVVVDGADPDVGRRARTVADRVVDVAARSGPAFARNRGVDATSAEVVLFVDGDVELRPDAVDFVRRYFHEHPEVAAVIGSYDGDPGGGSLVGQYKHLLNYYVHQHARRDGFTFWGALGAVRREPFLDVGGFDERYRSPQVEDIELGYRLRAAGHRIHVAREFQAKHLKQWHPRLVLKADVLDRALPWGELILERGFDDDLNISRVQRLKVVTAALTAGCLVATPRSRSARRAGLAGLASLAFLEAPLLRFFAARKGVRFTVVAAAWHWFSYLYSAAAFALACLRHLQRRRAGAVAR